MCPHVNAETPSAPVDKSEMVAIDNSNGVRTGRPAQATNGVNGAAVNGKKLTPTSLIHQQKLNPYAPRAADFLNNVSNFNIIESTLRGERSFFSKFKSRELIPSMENRRRAIR